jgi:hypothetical protein
MAVPQPEIEDYDKADCPRINPKPPLGRSIHDKHPTLLHFRTTKRAIFSSQTSIITPHYPILYKAQRFHVEHFITKI